MRIVMLVVLIALLFAPSAHCGQMYRADVTTSEGVTKSAQVDVEAGEVDRIMWDDGTITEVSGAGLNENSAQGYDPDGNLFDIRVIDYNEVPTE